MRTSIIVALTVAAGFAFVTATRADEGYIGVMVKKADGGIEITGLFGDAPADKAGMKKGDVIKKMDGNDVDNLPLMEFVKKIIETKPGDEIKFVISRDGKEMEVAVKVAKKGGS